MGDMPVAEGGGGGSVGTMLLVVGWATNIAAGEEQFLSSGIGCWEDDMSSKVTSNEPFDGEEGERMPLDLFGEAIRGA